MGGLRAGSGGWPGTQLSVFQEATFHALEAAVLLGVAISGSMI